MEQHYTMRYINMIAEKLLFDANFEQQNHWSVRFIRDIGDSVTVNEESFRKTLTNMSWPKFINPKIDDTAKLQLISLMSNVKIISRRDNDYQNNEI